MDNPPLLICLATLLLPATYYMGTHTFFDGVACLRSHLDPPPNHAQRLIRCCGSGFRRIFVRLLSSHSNRIAGNAIQLMAT